MLSSGNKSLSGVSPSSRTEKIGVEYQEPSPGEETFSINYKFFSGEDIFLIIIFLLSIYSIINSHIYLTSYVIILFAVVAQIVQILLLLS